MFWFFLKNTKSPKKSRSVIPASDKSAANKRHIISSDRSHPFRAVKVVCGYNQACEETQRVTAQVFLCAEAPWLPLPNCPHRESCQCHYLHLDDRRLLLRRDTDNGLPQRDIDLDRRGYLRDRRQA